MMELQNIVMQGNEHGQLRPNTIYAELLDEDGRMVIRGTLEYVLCTIRDYGYVVEGVSVERKLQRETECSFVALTPYTA